MNNVICYPLHTHFLDKYNSAFSQQGMELFQLKGSNLKAKG